MPLDPNIPLQAGQITSPLLGLSQGIQSGYQNALLKQQMDTQVLKNKEAQKLIQAKDMYQDALTIKGALERGDTSTAINLANARVQKIRDRRGDPIDTLGLTRSLVAGDMKTALQGLNQVISDYERLNLTSGSKDFEYLSKAGEFTPEERRQAALYKAGLAARPTEAITLAMDKGLTTQVAESKAQIEAAKEGAKEGAKLEQQARLLPGIRQSIKAAEGQAKNASDSELELIRSEAALPGLIDVADKLKKLSDLATFTTSGKVWNAVAKEFGFETKGGTARKEMESIADNQILPLLRDTFGAAFTENEGKRLRDTLLDPDAGPQAKRASIDAFIEQAKRNIETKRTVVNRLQPTQAAQSQATTTTPPVDLKTLSDDDLLRF